MPETKSVSGTREWAARSLNCMLGCAHGCLYCYAHSMAARFGRVGPEGWTAEKPRAAAIPRRVGGSVMYPTTHDLTPSNAQHTLPVLRELLAAGHPVLVVSKPHVTVVRQIVDDLAHHREQVLFRFTIGAASERILGFWEPDAPTFDERLACLQLAHERGWRTSVSMEPLLERAQDRVVALFEAVAPHVTEDIWIGKLNDGRARLALNGHLDAHSSRALELLEASQSAERLAALHHALGSHPLARWKESVKAALGLRLATAAEDSWAHRETTSS